VAHPEHATQGRALGLSAGVSLVLNGFFLVGGTELASISPTAEPNVGGVLQQRRAT